MKTTKFGELTWLIKDYVIAESIRAGLRGQENEAGGIFGNELYKPNYVGSTQCSNGKLMICHLNDWIQVDISSVLSLK